MHRKYNGHSLDELPFRAAFGIWGSWLCLLINVIALMAQFYVALYPVGGPNLNASNFFQLYLAGPLFIFLYLMWKAWSWFKRPADRPLYVRLQDIDIYTGMRDTQTVVSGPGVSAEQRRSSIAEMQVEQANRKKGVKGHVMSIIHSVI
jgi:amino acid transporter